MSDNIVWIADIDATLEEAPALAERGLAWLIAESIVQPVPDADERALGGAALYRPGPKAADWSVLVYDDLRLCGMEITVARTVFYSCPGPIGVRCRHCGASYEDEVPWSDAVDAWFAEAGDDTLACPACERSERIVDWTFVELDWAFGHLGFGFSNWAIDPRLADALGNVLGHRVKIAHQHF